MSNKMIVLFGIAAAISISACGTENHRSIEPLKVVVNSNYQGQRSLIAVGKISNKSQYMNGVFSSGDDKLGDQAKEILKNQIIRTNRFDLLDRDNMEGMEKESQYSGDSQKVLGAKYILTGSVTDFGRKVTGGQALFGIFGKSKEQVAYSKVTINVVEVKTSRSVYSVHGAGEYSLANLQILGSGSSAGYDATLNGKVLNLAIINAINNLTSAIETGQCQLE